MMMRRRWRSPITIAITMTIVTTVIATTIITSIFVRVVLVILSMSNLIGRFCRYLC